MNNQELQQLVEEISISCFSKPFIHQAIFNSRLKTTGGRYHLLDHHLDFNPRVLEIHGKSELIKVIKHELCHYHLHLAGRGYQHKDADFKRLLKEVGGTRFAPALTKTKQEIYVCGTCQGTIIRKRKFDLEKYRCGKCRGRLSHVKTLN